MSTTIYHNHHIIPRHVGGTDHPDNLVQLTVPEHAEAHRKLYEKYGRWQDKLAYRSLSGLIGKEEIIRQKNIQQRLGKKASEETKRKMSEIRLGKPLWPNGRPPFSTETRAKMSEAKKGIPQPKTTCPHCSKQGGISPMKRHHFNNCKEIST